MNIFAVGFVDNVYHMWACHGTNKGKFTKSGGQCHNVHQIVLCIDRCCIQENWMVLVIPKTMLLTKVMIPIMRDDLANEIKKKTLTHTKTNYLALAKLQYCLQCLMIIFQLLYLYHAYCRACPITCYPYVCMEQPILFDILLEFTSLRIPRG